MYTLHPCIHHIHLVYIEYTSYIQFPQIVRFKASPLRLFQLPLLLSSLNFVQHLLAINSTCLTKAVVFSSSEHMWGSEMTIPQGGVVFFSTRVKVVKCRDFPSSTYLVKMLSPTNLKRFRKVPQRSTQLTKSPKTG